MINQLSEWLVEAILQSTLAIAFTSCLALATSRALGRSKPWLSEVAWAIVLINGLLFARLAVELPMAEATTVLGESLPDDPIASFQSGWRSLSYAGNPGLTLDAGVKQRPAVTLGTFATLLSQPVFWVVVWAGGFGFVAVTRGRAYRRLLMELASCENAPEWAQQEWRDAATSLELSDPSPLRMSQSLGPLVAWTPSGFQVVVPEQLWRSLGGEQRRVVLLHEGSHIRRGDIFKSLLADFVTLLHWFNPFAWIGSRRFNEALEWACDAVSTQRQPGAPASLARALLTSASINRGSLPATAGLGAGSLATRVKRLLSDGSERAVWVPSAALMLLCMATMSLTLDIRLVAAEPAAFPNEPDHTTAGDPSSASPSEARSRNERADDVRRVSELGKAVVERLDQSDPNADSITAYLASDAWPQDVIEAYRYEAHLGLKGRIQAIVREYKGSPGGIDGRIEAVRRLAASFSTPKRISDNIPDDLSNWLRDPDFRLFLAGCYLPELQYAATAVHTPLLEALRGDRIDASKASDLAEELAWIRTEWPTHKRRVTELRSALGSASVDGQLSTEAGIAVLADTVPVATDPVALARRQLSLLFRETDEGQLALAEPGADEWLAHAAASLRDNVGD